MLVQAVEVLGLRGAAEWEVADLGVRVDLPPPPRGVAMADGLSLLHAAIASEGVARSTLSYLGLWRRGTELHLDDHGFAEQVVGLDPGALSALLAHPADRRLIVGATFTLDPVLFGQLREQSSRDPRVVTALGQDATVGVKVGWLFTGDLTAASVSVLELRVGRESFAVHAEERPRWVSPLLAAVSGRLGRVEAALPEGGLARHLLEGALSFDPQRRDMVRRLAEALQSEPFGLGRLELVRTEDGVELAFGPELLRARQLGPAAVRLVRLVAGALVLAPDVLVVDEPVDAAVVDWLLSCTEGPDATLEQVILVGGEGR